MLGRAPDFAGNGRWFNTPGDAPLDLKGLRGRVVLIDFWTYTCINCLRTMPYLRAWDGSYRDRGLTIVGVHTPEFAFERDSANVERAIADNRLRYPVAQDNDFATWRAWGNQYWPAKYLIDARGPRALRRTSAKAPTRKPTRRSAPCWPRPAPMRLGAPARARVEIPSGRLATPETYLGYERAEGFLPGPPRPGVGRYPGVDELPPVRFALSGTWNVTEEAATAVADAELDARVTARKVFLVLSSEDGRPRDVRGAARRPADRRVRGGRRRARRTRDRARASASTGSCR